MNDFGEANKDVVIMWSQVRASTNMIPYYIILGLTILAIPTYFIVKGIKRKINKKYI